MQTSANPAPTDQAAGKLPAGVHLASWGELYLDQEAGTGGRYPITISASNGVGPPATQAFVVVVTQQPGFALATARTSFRTGRRGTYRTQATGYPDPTITETGRLPAGLKLLGDKITGTPAARSGGVYRVHLTAANSSGPSASQTLTIVVKQAPRFVSPAMLTCKRGRRCHIAIRAGGFPVPRISEAGKLPRGLMFKAGKNGTATIAGTVSRRASPVVFHIKLTATSSAGRALQRVTIRVT